MNFGKLFAPYSGLNKGIYILFIARVINSTGNFVFTFLAMFLTATLGMGEDKAGFFIMLSSIAAIPGNLLGGILADRIGRRVTIITSMLLSALCVIPCAFLGKSPAIPWLIILSVFFGSMMHPASSAMVADLVPAERRKSAYALLYLGINIGMSIGPLIAGFLFKNHIKLLFLGDAITTIITAAVIFIYIKESIPTRVEIEESLDDACSNEKAEEGNAFILLLKRPYLLVFSLLTVVITFVYSQHSFSLPIYSNFLFGDNGPKAFGTLMTLNCIVVVALTTFLTALTRRVKPVLNTAYAAGLYAIGFGMLYFTKQYSLILLSTFIWTVGEILTTTNFQVYIADHSPITHRGRFNAVVNLISRAGFAIGPAVMGLYIKDRGIGMVWPVISLLAALTAAGMYVLYLVEGRAGRRSISGNVNT